MAQCTRLLFSEFVEGQLSEEALWRALPLSSLLSSAALSATWIENLDFITSQVCNKQAH